MSENAPNASERKGSNLLGGLLVGMALGAGGYLLGTQLGQAMRGAGSRPLERSASEVVLLLLVAIVAVGGSLLAHELGHLLAGRLVGFRAYLLIIGPFRLERGEDRWHLHLNRRVALAGGLAGSAPTDTVALTRRMAVMIAGGPATSVISGLLALGAAWATQPQTFGPETSNGVVALTGALGAFGAASVLIGVATLVPSRAGGFASDGARLLALARGGPAAERDAALAALVGASIGGIRPRDLPAALIDTVCAVQDGSTFEFCGWQYAQMRAADLGRDDEARALLERLLTQVDRLPPMLRAGVHYDAARQFAALGDYDAARAQLALGTGPAIGAPHLQPLAEAAVLLSEGKEEAARPKLAAAKTGLARSIDRGTAKWLGDALAALENSYT